MNALRENAGFTVREFARRIDAPLGTISGWCTGRHLPTLSQKDLFLRLLTTCGITDSELVDEWLACWLRLRRPLGQQRSDAPTPYRGLEPFQPEHTSWFFGRAEMTATLVERVTSASPGFVVAVGSSGAGKSSLLRAGLLPTLTGHERPESRWHGLAFNPGPRPTAALAAQLALVADLSPGMIEAELRDQPERAALRVRDLDSGPLLLVVDQFEELFTMNSDVVEQEVFLNALTVLSAAGTGRVRVVAGMRADFYPEALRWPVLLTSLQNNQVTVGSMSDDELRLAIVEPARLAGLEVEAGLVDLLLHDLGPVGARHGTLPLLSHALLATWEQGQQRAMTIADYMATGGIHGAIAKTAENVFTDLTSPEQVVARRLFLRLVHVGDNNTPDTRRRCPLEELAGGGDCGADTKGLLGRFVDRRLVTADVDGVEISHEALIESWPRLRQWIDNDRSDLRLHRRLAEAAANWADTGRDPGALYRGVRLDAAVEWVTRQEDSELNQLEQGFVDASVHATQAERVRERRTTRRLRWLVAALATLLLVAAGTTIYSIRQSEAANRERNLAVSRQVAGTANRLAGSDPALAAQLAVAAYRVAPTVEATSSLISAAGRPTVSRMVRPGGALQAAAVNPAGTLLTTAGAADSDTAGLLWDLRDRHRPRLLDARLTGHLGPVYAIAFSADGTTLATGSTDKTVRLWDVSDPARPRPLGEPLTGPDGDVLTVGFTPAGDLLAVGSRDGKLQFWDVRDREKPSLAIAGLPGGTGEVRSVAFHPGGDVVAVGEGATGRGTIRLFDIHDRQSPQPLGSPLTMPSRLNAVAFSPDGKTLAAGSNDATVRLWQVADPSRPVPSGSLSGLTGWINAIAFSSDSRHLATANASARVQAWDLADRRMWLDLPHSEPVTAVAFREDDRVLHTNGADGIARRWSVPGPVLPAEDRQVTGLAFHPDRPVLVAGGIDVRLWDLENHDHPSPLGPPLTAPPNSDRMTGTIALNSTGGTLAAATRSGNAILLWNTSDPTHPAPHPNHLTGHTALIENVTFSHHSNLLASTSDDGTVRLWNTSDTPVALATLDLKVGFVYAAAFTPDDTVLAAVTQNGYLALWDIRDPRNPKLIGAPIKAALDDARSLAISPDGRTLAVGIANGTVQLWNIENPGAPRSAGPAVTGPDGFVHALAFSPDGSLLAGGAGAGQTWMWKVGEGRRLDPFVILQSAATTIWALQFTRDGHTLAAAAGDIHIWHTDPQRAINHICTNAGDSISETEWAKNVPGESYRKPCP